MEEKNTEAEKCLQTFEWDVLRFKAAEQEIQWNFNSPSEAWWGEWKEYLVQIVK